ncbi:hypothetical protein [Gilliamella apicola]|uniref:hypothetical protein n=1 Tax=Gilliamella apicola TaxID=1196095 RepID=UPI001FD51E28|nr:hypothetical protein [Gilliamella apicola]
MKTKATKATNAKGESTTKKVIKSAAAQITHPIIYNPILSGLGQNSANKNRINRNGADLRNNIHESFVR